MQIVNTTTGLPLGDAIDLANNVWTRFVGLMGRRELPAGGGLVIRPCNSIHMFFMRMPLDIVYAAKDGEVVRVTENLKPWRVGPLVRRSHMVIELPVGAIAASRTAPGHVLSFG